MALDTTTHTPVNTCQGCGYKHDAATDVFHNHQPSSGDVILCIRCGHVAIFNPDLTLREPTARELLNILKEPDVERARFAIWKLWQEKRAE